MSIFAAAEQRAQSLPSSDPIRPTQWFTDLFGGNNTASGIDVDADSAISLSTVFNALTLLSESLAQLPVAPFLEYEENGMQKRRKYKEHFSYELVAKRPNDFMSSYTFRKMLMGQLVRFDRAYAVISRNGNGQAKSLFPFPSKWVQLKQRSDGRLIYELTNHYSGGDKEYISPASMFHLVGYTENGLEGRSRIDVLSESLGNSLAAERFTGNYFGKGVNVSGFIKHPGKLKDQDAVSRLKNSFAKANAGPNNEFGVGVLEEGAEFERNEVEPEKAQLNETRKVNGQVVAQIWNIPLSFLKYLDSTSYSEAEQEDLKFSKYTLAPWCTNWEQEFERKLLTEREKREGNIYFKHNMSALLRGDMESRANFYESMAKIGAYSPNDVLRKEDENGYEGGDLHVVSPGAQTVENLNNEPTNEDE
jgi:HK97 family phage portal protein